MQYDFKNIDIDTYELTYKNKKNEEIIEMESSSSGSTGHDIM